MTIHGVPPHRGGQVVDDGPIDQFIRTLSSLSAEEWQRRIESLQTLVNSTPDYSTAYSNNNSNDSDDDAPNNTTTIIPWYRSSKSVRRLASPLKTLLLDARSAVVKEATELIGVLLSVKLQCHPSFTVAIMADANNLLDGDDDDEKKNEDKQHGREHDDDEDVFNNTSTTTPTKQPPPFVGRLLFKDLLPSILQLSSQTVKVIRTYGITMTLQIIPHCRVKSALIILLERMKSDKNRNVREDCARYLRCVLETWPVDKQTMMEEAVVEGGSNDNIAGIGHNTNTRTEEQLTHETIQQIGMGLGRALTDPAQPVRNETKRGFQVVFQRYRPVWNEVMNSGIIRDVRLRKNLLEAASRSGEDNNGTLLFDDMASLGDLSLNTSTSFTSMRSNTSYRSYASRGLGGGGGGGSASVGGGGGGRAVPSVIGTPKVTRKYGVSSSRYSPSASTSSPSYTRTTTSSSGSKIRNKESSSTFSSSTYVLSSGHVVSSSSTPQRTSRLPPPSPSSTPQRTSRLLPPSPSSSASPRKSSMTPPKQPFASLMQTPQPNQNENTNNAIRQSPKSAKMLRKRLSRRISGIDALEAATTTTNAPEEYKRQLSSIAEKNDDGNITSTTSPLSATNNNMNSNTDEITYVALEVISAHLAHLDKIENQVSREKDLLLDLNKQLGISISDATNSDELAQCLNKLTEEQVCDYFEAVHICVDLQRNASESLLREMERISQGGGGGDLSMNSSDVMDTTSADGSSNGVMDGLPQSPLSSKNSNGLERVQRDLGAQF